MARPDSGEAPREHAPLPDYAEEVLALVERIPPGRVMSYGAIADWLGHGGPRQVGAVMSRYGGAVGWHRVVAAAGRPPLCHEGQALRMLRAEGTPLRGNRVDMARAAWHPHEDASAAEA